METVKVQVNTNCGMEHVSKAKREADPRFTIYFGHRVRPQSVLDVGSGTLIIVAGRVLQMLFWWGHCVTNGTWVDLRSFDLDDVSVSKWTAVLHFRFVDVWMLDQPKGLCLLWLNYIYVYTLFCWRSTYDPDFVMIYKLPLLSWKPELPNDTRPRCLCLCNPKGHCLLITRLP